MQQHLAGKAHAKKVKAVAKLEADAAAKTETAVNAEALRINGKIKLLLFVAFMHSYNAWICSECVKLFLKMHLG